MDTLKAKKGKIIQKALIEDAPKYGNDDDYVDNLVVDAYNTYIDEVKKYPNTRYGRGPIGGVRYAGTSSISANVGQGKRLQLLQMDVMQELLLLKDALHHMQWIKMGQLLCLRQFLSYQLMKLQEEYY